MFGGATAEQQQHTGHGGEVTVTNRDFRGIMRDRRVSEHRIIAVRIGLVLSWALLTILGAAVVGQSRLGDAEISIALAADAIGLTILTVAPWRALAYRPLGDAYMVLWAALLVAGIFTADSIRTLPPLLAAYVLVVAFGGVTARSPITLAIIGGVGIAGYTVDLVGRGGTASGAELAIGVGLLAMTAAVASSASLRLVRTARVANRRLDRLRAREKALRAEEEHLSHLYGVAAAIGAGTKMADVVGEIARRMATALDCSVALLLHYRPEEPMLEVLSPIWVAGQPVRAQGRELHLNGGGVPQQVFVSGRPTTSSDPLVMNAEPLFADLGITTMAAAPLHLESEAIGVVIVADKAAGEFTSTDVDRLTALAAPAALIIDHLGRFEQARLLGEEMAEVARMKGDFVSVVSHELRTPLTSIIGALATLSRPQLAPDDPNARELLASARRQADRLKGLIEDLLVVSRLDNRAVPLHLEPVDVGVLLREVVRQVPDTHDRVRVDLSPTLPTVSTDATHLERIFTNLLSNAIRYAPESPIEIVGRVHGGDVHVSVIDHGPGIPYELHDHVFNRFTQVADAHTRHRGGTGLGLSIVRGLTEAMGGRVWFEPTVGGGATFVVALPQSVF